MKLRWSYGFFGVKDLFTIINLLGGVFGIYYAMTGRLEWAGYAIFAGYLFGDSLDGQVARATNTGNKFGSEFDSAADHIGQGIAPSLIVYKSYELGGQQTLGFILMAALICTASIRQARFNTAPFNFPLCYAGLPRTVSGIVALSLPNSELFFHAQPWKWQITTAVILLISALNLIPIPYMTHKGKRKMQLYAKVLAIAFVSLPLVLFAFARQYVFDFVFVISFGYAATGWIPIHPEERRSFYAEYRRWSSEVASLK